MTIPTLLRIAAIVALVQFAGHGALFLRAKPTHGPAEIAVVTAMKENRFNFGGSTRSYWDMYFGYGVEAAAVCLVEAILLWQLAGIARVSPGIVKPIIALVLVANLAHIVLVLRYFFLVPLVPDVVISALLAVALITSAPAGGRVQPGNVSAPQASQR